MKTRLTPTQQAMLELLADGKAHPRGELLDKCQDLSQVSAIANHLSAIRAFLEPKGETVNCVLKGRSIFYQHVRLLASANDGMT